MEALRQGFGGLLRFSGRSSNQAFWVYAAVVVGASMAVMTALFIAVMAGFAVKLTRFIREHPDQVTVTQIPGGTSWQVNGYHPELMPDMGLFMLGLGIGCGVMLFLLAAAVTRRLHDIGRSGAWGLLPVPFLAGGLVSMALLFQGFADAESAGVEPPASLAGLFVAAFLSNLTYLGLLGVLIFLLATRGTRGPNRFGEPPASP